MIKIILGILAALMLIEGLIASLFPAQIEKIVKKIFKNKKNIVWIGLIEIILALLILFLIF